MIAARFPPAEEPPIAKLWGLSDRRRVPVVWSQRRTSQLSWTAAG